LPAFNRGATPGPPRPPLVNRALTRPLLW
jgi:hypothetical protein